MEPSCSWSEANWISSVLHHRVLEVTHERYHKQWRGKGNIEPSVPQHSCTGGTVERKEHRLSKPKTNGKARRAALAAAEIVSCSHAQKIALES